MQYTKYSRELKIAARASAAPSIVTFGGAGSLFLEVRDRNPVQRILDDLADQVRKQRTHDSATESPFLGQNIALSPHARPRSDPLRYLDWPRRFFLQPVFSSVTTCWWDWRRSVSFSALYVGDGRESPYISARRSTAGCKSTKRTGTTNNSRAGRASLRVPSWDQPGGGYRFSFEYPRLTRIYCRYSYLRRKKEMKAVASAESFA